MIANAGQNKITVTDAGIYEIAASMSFSGSANTEFIGTIYVNGVAATNLRFKRQLSSGGDVGSAGISGIKNIGANQEVEFFIRADSSGQNFLLEEGNLNVHSIGGP